MKRKINIIGLTLFFTLTLFSLAFAEESITITTYYPSPYGSYNELTTTGNTYLATNSGRVGIGTAGPTFSIGRGLHIAGVSGTPDAVIRLSEWTSGLSNFELRSTARGTSGNRLEIGEGSDTFLTIRSDDDGGGTTSRGNVGIGTAGPGEKLEVNGAIKFGADGSAISKAPRVIHTEDPVSGCPPARAAGTDLFTQTFTLARAASVYINASLIRNYSGRADMYLYVDGAHKDQTLDYTPSAQWFDDNVHWAGTLAAGSHTVSLRGNIANIWGCGPTWGSIDTIIFE